MKKINHLIFVVFFGLFLIACEKEMGPSAEDHFLNYEIPDIPVDQDYLIGMNYTYTVSNYGSDAVKELFTSPPLLGEYAKITDLVEYEGQSIPAIDVHLKWMNEAKVDFLILTLRSGSTAASNYRSDTTYIGHILRSPELGEMKFALLYDFSGFSLGSTAPSESDSTMIIENKVDGVENYIKDYCVHMKKFFDMDNYLTLDGKKVVFQANNYRLFSRDNAELTRKVKTQLKEEGHDLYLAGLHEKWSPPARYEHIFRGGAVDAIYHDCYANVPSNDLSRVHMFHTTTDQAWKYSKEMFNSWGVDYIPNISPAWNQNLGSPNSSGTYYSPYIPRDMDWFIKFCNVAKMNVDTKRLIMVSSWNNWRYDSQVEPAESYGTDYLDVLRKQFKK